MSQALSPTSLERISSLIWFPLRPSSAPAERRKEGKRGSIGAARKCSKHGDDDNETDTLASPASPSRKATSAHAALNSMPLPFGFTTTPTRIEEHEGDAGDAQQTRKGSGSHQTHQQNLKGSGSQHHLTSPSSQGRSSGTMAASLRKALFFGDNATDFITGTDSPEEGQDSVVKHEKTKKKSPHTAETAFSRRSTGARNSPEEEEDDCDGNEGVGGVVFAGKAVKRAQSDMPHGSMPHGIPIKGFESWFGGRLGRKEPSSKLQCEKTHLYVLVHGINSSRQHLRYLANALKRALGETALVHLAAANEAKIPTIVMHPTHDGVDRGGSRLADEIRALKSKPEHKALRYISFIGNSMGGLYTRYCIALLYDTNTCTVAGLQPVSFISLASPHLGVCGLAHAVLEKAVKGMSLYGGRTAQQMFMVDSGVQGSADRSERSVLLEGGSPSASTGSKGKRAGVLKSYVLHQLFAGEAGSGEDRSDREALLRWPLSGILPILSPTQLARRNSPNSFSPPNLQEDAGQEGEGGEGESESEKGPLLIRMCSDGRLPFRTALAAFRFRVLYGNTCNDPLVRYQTANISPCNLPGWRVRTHINAEYPHIIDDSGTHATDWPPADEHCFLAPSESLKPYFAGNENEKEIRHMMESLSSLGWRRVSVRFRRHFHVQSASAHAVPDFLAHDYFQVGVNAHNHLPVVRPLVDSDGRDTVAHICAVMEQAARALGESKDSISGAEQRAHGQGPCL